MHCSTRTRLCRRYEANLTADSSDLGAQLRISFPGPAELLVDVVSLFPLENVAKGALNPYPFRPDLLQYVKDLNPRCALVDENMVVPHQDIASRASQACTGDGPS